MRRRLRKKKHLGEFKLFGVPILITRNTTDDSEDFWHELFEEALASNSRFAMGSGKAAYFDFFVELGIQRDEPFERLQRITAWLDSRADVETYTVGKVTDAWHGPFED